MRDVWHDLWGCAAGPVARLAPPTRLATGAAVFVAGLAAPLDSVAGVTVLAGGVIGWVVACRPPRRVLRTLLLASLVLFAPFLLLTPIIHAGPHAAGWTWARSLAAPVDVVVRGVSAMVVSVATVTTLTASDLHEGLARLPVPRLVAAILVQILHQTGALVRETRQVAAAMAVRGASGGARAAWRVLWSVPQVWLPRVAQRAERVGAAMEVRGHEGEVVAFAPVALRRADAVALVLGAGWLVAAVVVRWGRGG